MLKNGLGELLAVEVCSARRFVDLFAGSGAVSIHVACRFAIPVLAFDLQQYSAVLTGAVVSRQLKLNWAKTWAGWVSRAQAQVDKVAIPIGSKMGKSVVAELRLWCDSQTAMPITRAYGGHYFSPEQAVWIDALRTNLPHGNASRTTALAALIRAASQCAAAPGHTAQPFQPTPTARRFLVEAWRRNILERTRSAFEVLADQCARERGGADVCDANHAAEQLRKGDLAFIDPPYSDVHYSRFYHVLETIANGQCGEVTGVGRYPAPELRPRSKYSVLSESEEAFEDLLETVARRGARAIVSSPDHDCSNGLGGDLVREIATDHFRVRARKVQSKFSTLGGSGENGEGERGRVSRHHANELMLVLDPK